MSALAQRHAELIIQRYEERTGKRPDAMWVSKEFRDMMFYDMEMLHDAGFKDFVFYGVRIFTSPMIEGFEALFTNPLTPARRWDALRQRIMAIRKTPFASSSIPSSLVRPLNDAIDQAWRSVLQMMDELEAQTEEYK